MPGAGDCAWVSVAPASAAARLTPAAPRARRRPLITSHRDARFAQAQPELPARLAGGHEEAAPEGRFLAQRGDDDLERGARDAGHDLAHLAHERLRLREQRAAQDDE